MNNSAQPVQIERTIKVEYQDKGGWTAVSTEFNAVATCVRSAATGTGPVTIAAGTTLVVQRWRGFSCSGQCQGTCRRNIYSGPGPFRFVVTLLPGRRQLTSAPFAMPLRPSRPPYQRNFRIAPN